MSNLPLKVSRDTSRTSKAEMIARLAETLKTDPEDSAELVEALMELRAANEAQRQ